MPSNEQLHRMQAAVADCPTIGRVTLAKTAQVSQPMAQRFLARRKESKPTDATTDYYTVVSLHDWHVPYHDTAAVNCQLNFCQYLQPDEIVLHELHDFYGLSKFNKNPQRAFQLQDEIDETFKLMKQLRSYCPNSKIRLLKSNHTDRLQRYLWSNATALCGLRALELPSLFRLDELDITYQANYHYKGVLFKHGHIVRQQSAYTAHAEYQREGTSGMSGHCFDEQTEILTKRGWVKGFDLMPTDVVGTMNKQSKQFEWNNINEFHQYDDYTQLYKIKATTIDLLVTDKHGLIFETRNGKQHEAEAQEAAQSTKDMLFYNSTKSNPQEQYLDYDENVIRLLVNIVADGHFEQNAIRWHLRKDRKITHLRQLLDRLGLEYSVCPQTTLPTTKIRLNTHYAPKFMKMLGGVKQLPAWFANLTPELVRVVLDEYSITDGCKNSSATNSYQICSSKEAEIDVLQEMFVKNGYRTSKIQNGSTFVLTVNTRDKTRIDKENITTESYTGKVWCVSVDNGTVLVRRNGKVTVTLNTHRGGAFYRTVRGGSYAWIEGGCACDLQPEYIEDDVANWQHGLGIATYERHGSQYHLQFVPIITGKLLYGAKIITGEPS